MNIDALNNYFNKGTASFYNAGKVVVMLQNQGYSLAEISRQSGILNARNLKFLIDIYEGRLQPELLIKVPATCAVRKLPYEKQKEVINNGVELLRPKGKQLVKRYVSFAALSLEDCRTVFNSGKIRSLTSQRRFLRREKVGPVNYKVVNGRVKVLRQAVFNKEQLTEMLAAVK